jgi:hypothetical protein
MLYQFGWSTLPGLRGLACSDFRAMAVAEADNERGVAIEIGSAAQRDALLQQLEAYFAARRFTNAADAFDSVKAFILDQSARQSVL